MKHQNEIYSQCLYFTSNTLSRIMSKMADQEFAPIGLSSSYAFLVMTVVDKPGIQPKEISKIMELTPSTVTRLIEKLEFKQLLSRKIVGRTTEVFPTDSSIELSPKIIEAWYKLYDKYCKILGKEFAEELIHKVYFASQELK